MGEDADVGLKSCAVGLASTEADAGGRSTLSGVRAVRVGDMTVDIYSRGGRGKGANLYHRNSSAGATVPNASPPTIGKPEYREVIADAVWDFCECSAC